MTMAFFSPYFFLTLDLYQRLEGKQEYFPHNVSLTGNCGAEKVLMSSFSTD